MTDRLEAAYLALALALPLLKAGGWLAWPWAWALAPLAVPAGVLALVLVVAGAMLVLDWVRS